MKRSLIKNYAKLIARVGANIQKGQEVFITAELESRDFILLLAEECYRAGASNVFVEWKCQRFDKLAARFESVRALSCVESREEAKLAYQAETLPVTIKILSADPDGMKGADREKITLAQMARSAITKPYADAMTNRHQWCVAAVPSVGWAKKVFPEERANAAVEKLWQLILKTARADGKDPLTDWLWHNRELKEKCDALNAYKFVSLEYRSANGTNLKVGLIDKAKFISGKKSTADGKYFNPNIPTEECFTTPKKGEAEGIAYAVKPLSYGGELIENFWIRFEKGRAVACGAEKNEALLKSIIAMDEGAAYLGECALVPYDSPINRCGVLFYNTLFDENACCHLALGRGYSNTIENFADYMKSDFIEMGVNDSDIHVDFMIGAEDLEVTGVTADGERVAVFRNGTWAI
ncbi:MAG TPA: aminopeptidase [Candidatus Borkfalkia avistercoris]|uniref:Aminopeptidase n=1 Tax=Candidatus Borkfalkia avistercoris TaxID=2838504 RepID=A0A9D2CYL1_9FIRM|nr:aminopeptidase [Candidatus Borkfalkia avistercoris]